MVRKRLHDFDLTLFFPVADLCNPQIYVLAKHVRDSGIRLKLEVADSYALFDNYSSSPIYRGQQKIEAHLTRLAGEKFIGRKRYQRWLNTPYPAIGNRTPSEIPPETRRDLLEICLSGQPL